MDRDFPDKLFYRIGEVADIVGIQSHVLRYWETEFPQLRPQKNRSGHRIYEKRDIELIRKIKSLLYDHGYTIPGAQKELQRILRERQELEERHQEEATLVILINDLKTELQSILDLLDKPLQE